MKAISNDDILQPLNPADYFTLAMDDEIRRENMPGSICGFGLELDRLPDIGQLNQRIDEFARCFPTALACLKQRGNQFYWNKRTHPEKIFFHHSCPEGIDDSLFLHTTVDGIINRREPRETSRPIEFHLIQGIRSHFFLLTWLHPFCDARSVELILKFLGTDDPAQRSLFDNPKIGSLVDTQLAKFKWWQKIFLFYKANRTIHRLDKYLSIQHAELSEPPKQLTIITEKFTEEQTSVILQNARKYCGLTGISLYYIGCMMRALHQLQPDQPGEAYCVPYAFNLRKQKALSPMLGNHIGTLFAQAPKQALDDRQLLFEHLKQQHVQAVRQQLDYAFLPVMWAAKWLPLKKYGSELRRSYKDGSERSSFWFSDIGPIAFEQNFFFGSDITGLFHLSQISSPPGLALLCCQYRKQLTLSYNFIEPLFSKLWLKRLHAVMEHELLGLSDQ